MTLPNRLLTYTSPPTSPLSRSGSSSTSSSPTRIPERMRRSNSWGSSSTSSSESADTADTELREWDYSRASGRRGVAAGAGEERRGGRESAGREQDEVQRKRWETRRVREKIAQRTWREFWG